MPSSKVSFHFQTTSFNLSDRKKLKSFIRQLFSKENGKFESLHYIFCTDEFLLEINQQYLQHDFYTDIITFNLSESTSVVGEIYISIDRVKDNASQFSSSFKSEIHRVIFHGALHLCGYDDKTSSKKKIMSQREDYYLERYFK